MRMINLFRLLLLVGFVAYAYMFLTGMADRLIDGFSIQVLGELFIVGTIVFSFLIALSTYETGIVDRMVLAICLFGFIGSLVFLGNNPVVMYYYNEYIRIIPFICLFMIGLITTFYTPSGFIGVLSEDKKAIRLVSLKLLALVVIAGLWSFFIKNYLSYSHIHNLYYNTKIGSSYHVYMLPWLLIQAMYNRWGKQLLGEKQSSWKFKW